MSTKTSVMIGMVVGSSAGSYVPALWGDGLLSYWGLFFSLVGGIIGIYLGYKLNSNGL